jgi:hypothetical protein
VATAPERRSTLTHQSVTNNRNLVDAKRALIVEQQLVKKAPTLMIKFPDPPIDSEIVKGFHSQINMVQFQQPHTPRSCFVQLTPGADPEKVKQDLSKTMFGNGYLTAEWKDQTFTENPDKIDPFTLYIGNLSSTIKKNTLKQEFPSSTKIEIKPKIGFASICFSTVDEAISAFKKSYDKVIANQPITVRFRRTDMSSNQFVTNEIIRVEEEPSFSEKETDNTETGILDPGILENTSQITIKQEIIDEVQEDVNCNELDSKNRVLEESQRMLANGNESILDVNVSIKIEPNIELEDSDDEDFRICQSEEEDDESEEEQFSLAKFLEGVTWDSGNPDEETKVRPV